MSYSKFILIYEIYIICQNVKIINIIVVHIDTSPSISYVYMICINFDYAGICLSY